MPTFFAIQTQLSLIKSQIIQLSEFSAGRPESDDEADKDLTTLDRIDQQLALILRDLKSADHLARIQLDNIHKLPPDQRFSAKQSFEQKSRDAAKLSAEAESLKSLVLDLLTKNGLLTPVQAAQKTMDLIKDLQEHLPLHAKMQTQQNVGYPAYQPPPPRSPSRTSTRSFP